MLGALYSVGRQARLNVGFWSMLRACCGTSLQTPSVGKAQTKCWQESPASPSAGQHVTSRRHRALTPSIGDDVVLIDDALIRDAVGDLLFSAKLLAETAGAAATAAVLGRAIPFREGECVVAIVSGGNIDAEKLTGLLR